MSTGVIGAEQFIRSMGILIGGYPNEIEMIDRINQGLDVEIKTSYIVYFVLIAMVAAGGIWNQYRLKKRDDARENGLNYLHALAGSKDKKGKKEIELLEEKYSKPSEGSDDDDYE